LNARQNRPYHVLSVVSSLGFGGDESRLASMIRCIDPAKYRFSVLVMPTGPDFSANNGSLVPVIEAAGVRVHYLDNPVTASWLPSAAAAGLRLGRKIRAVTRLIREWRVDLVDARLEGGMIVGVPAGVLAGRPSVSTLYDAVPWRKFPLWWLFRAVTINLTQAVITDSAIRQLELTRWRWSRPRAAWNIPNGIAVPTPTRPAGEVRRSLGIPEETGMCVIAQIAGLVPYKGQMILLEAARRVIASDRRAFFLIVGYCRGEKEYERCLRDTAERLNISHRVRIGPYPGSIGDIWQLVDIHAHASLFDSLPNALLEGMSLAKPVVATAVGGIPEAVDDQISGLLVPPNDSQALAQGLLQLLRNPAVAASFGEAAKSRYLARYHPIAMASALEGCFASVLSKGPSAPRGSA
jgi:L-malate glycosyltransferase